MVLGEHRHAGAHHHSCSSAPPLLPPPYGVARVGAQAHLLEMFRCHLHGTSIPLAPMHSPFCNIPLQPLLPGGNNPGRFVVPKAVLVVHIWNMQNHIYIQLIKKNIYCCSSYYIYWTKNNIFDKYNLKRLGDRKKNCNLNIETKFGIKKDET